MAATTTTPNTSTSTNMTTTSNTNTSPYNDDDNDHPPSLPAPTIPTSQIPTPLSTDVICGRGGGALRHPGNQTYRRIVTLNKGLYTTCKKSDKLKISRSIVAAIREQNGRFLERDNTTKLWYDIGDKKAVEKTSQALREGQPKLRKKINDLETKGELPVGGAAAVTLKPGEPTRDKKTTKRCSNSSSSASTTGGAPAAPDDVMLTPNDQVRKSYQGEEEQRSTSDSNLSGRSSANSSSSGIAAAAAATAFIARSSPHQTKKEVATSNNNDILSEIHNLPLDPISTSTTSSSVGGIHQSFHDSDVTQLMGNVTHSRSSAAPPAAHHHSYQESFQDSFGDFDPSTLEHVQRQYIRRSIHQQQSLHAQKQQYRSSPATTDSFENGGFTAGDMAHLSKTLQDDDYDDEDENYNQLQSQAQDYNAYNMEYQPQQTPPQAYHQNQLPPPQQLPQPHQQQASQKRKLSTYRKLRPSINFKNPHHDLGLESCRSIMSDFSALGESMRSLAMMEAEATTGGNEGGGGEEVMIWDASAQNLGNTTTAAAAAAGATSMDNDTIQQQQQQEQDRRAYFLKVKNYRANKLAQLQNSGTISNSNKAVTSFTRLNDETNNEEEEDDGLGIHESCMLESSASLLSNFSFTPEGTSSANYKNFKDGDITIDGCSVAISSIISNRSSVRSSISTLSRDVKVGVIGGGLAGDLDFDLQSKQSLFSSFSSALGLNNNNGRVVNQQQVQQQSQSQPGSSDADTSMCLSMRSLAVSEFSGVGGDDDNDDDDGNDDVGEPNKILNTFES